MEGFTKLPKMQCFKEGGSVQNIMKRGGKVDAADIAEDKKLIKKAFKQHDKAEHDKSPTEIKLRKGGRSKKENGSVKKYKAGGNVSEPGKKSGDLDPIKKIPVTGDKKADAQSAADKVKNNFSKYKAGGNVSEPGKKSGDKDPTIRVKATGNKKADAEMFAGGGRADAPSAPVNQSMGTFNKKRGGKIKKMADGGMTNPMTDASALLNPIRSAGTALKNNIMGTPEQNRIAQARMDMIAKKKAAEQAALLGGLGGKTALNQGAMAGAQMQGVQPQNVMQQMANSPEAMPDPTGMPAPAMPMPATGPAMKLGGRTKKMNTGGTAC